MMEIITNYLISTSKQFRIFRFSVNSELNTLTIPHVTFSKSRVCLLYQKLWKTSKLDPISEPILQHQRKFSQLRFFFVNDAIQQRYSLFQGLTAVK